MIMHTGSPALGLVVALVFGPLCHAAAATEPVELEWQQLIPTSLLGDVVIDDAVPQGVVEHGSITPFPGDFGGLVDEYNGKLVRLPGYLLPLEFDDTKVREFLLVPYVGACIHVPPPPPNQIVYVTIEGGFEIGGYFEPVWVTGTFDSASISNELADIGYQIEAEGIEPYEE